MILCACPCFPPRPLRLPCTNPVLRSSPAGASGGKEGGTRNRSRDRPAGTLHLAEALFLHLASGVPVVFDDDGEDVATVRLAHHLAGRSNLVRRLGEDAPYRRSFRFVVDGCLGGVNMYVKEK